MILRQLTYLSLLTLPLLFGGCKKSPIERTEDGSGAGALNGFGSGNFVIFGDELQSGGGAFFYPGGENQLITFEDQSNPIGQRSIRYTWNGNTTGGQTTFAGFDLMHTPTQATYTSTSGRDLRAAGYTKITFYARGALASNNVLKIEAADDGENSTSAPCLVLSMNGSDTATGCTNTAQLTSSWQVFTITIPNSALATVKDFFKATIIFTNPVVGSSVPGQGGTIYFDQIQYTP
jgi:hypothetical protein